MSQHRGSSVMAEFRAGSVPSELVGRRTLRLANVEAVAVAVVVALLWLLSLASYSPGQREIAPLSARTLDWIAQVKVATRLIGLLVLGVLLAQMPATPAKQRALRRVVPFGLFALWGMLSALWSPMPAVSLGHAGETLMLTALAAGVALVSTEDRRLSRLLFHMCAAVLVVSLLNAGLGAKQGVSAADGSRPFGFMHPNLAAQVAGIGLVLLVGSYLIAGWGWTKWLLLPAILVQGWVLFVSQSRTANGATFAALVACLALFARRRSLLLLAVVLAIVLTGYLALDPHATALGNLQGKVMDYVTRGQSKSEFMSATGRTEMWAVGWESFLESPLWGHGNWVMTRNGAVPVWGQYRWQTSHNLVLHVLTGTGLVGAWLVLWGLWGPVAAAWHEWRRKAAEGVTAAFVLVVVGWFFLTGLYELSFLGPVSPASLAFFVTLGMAVGRLP